MRRHITTIGLVVAIVGALASPAAAFPSKCLGLTPTIFAVEGTPTAGTVGDDVILGTAGDDFIDGGSGDDVICALGGDDAVIGGRGNDRVDGGFGSDLIYGNVGNDHLDGGPGNDELRGGLGQDLLIGHRGGDALHGGRHSDVLDGGDGKDSLFGGSHEDVLDGGGENDSLDGGQSADVIDGGSGADQIWGRGGADVLAGGDGNDEVRAGRGLDECTGETLTGCEIAPVTPGDSGGHVRYLQRALATAKLYRGAIDGVYPEDDIDRPGPLTGAVYAFHKLYDEPEGDQWTDADHVSALWTLADWALLDSFQPMEPKGRYSEPNRLEVDAHRELMWLILDDQVAAIFHVSIGGEYRYYYNGEYRIAHTPRGDWDIDRYSYGRKVAGYQYKSWYFEQNYYAVHGFYKVPPYPASHGCVRIYYDDADWITNRLEVGWPIHVWDY